MVTQHDPALLLAELQGKKVHRVEEIEAWAFAPAFLDELASHIGDRGCAFDLTVSEGDLYVTINGASVQATPKKIDLATHA